MNLATTSTKEEKKTGVMNSLRRTAKGWKLNRKVIKSRKTPSKEKEKVKCHNSFEVLSDIDE